MDSFTYTTLDVPAGSQEPEQEPEDTDIAASVKAQKAVKEFYAQEESPKPEQREGLDFDRLREQVDDLAEDPNDIPAYLWGELPRLIDMAERCEAAEVERDRFKAALYAPPGQQDYLSYTELRQRLVEAEQERTNAVCDRDRLKAELAALRSGNAGLSNTEKAAVDQAVAWAEQGQLLFPKEYTRLLDIIARLSTRQPTLPLPWRKGSEHPEQFMDVVYSIRNRIYCGQFLTQPESWSSVDWWVYASEIMATLPKDANS